MRARHGVLLLALVALALAACDGTPGPTIGEPVPAASPTAQDTRVIGLVGTLSTTDSWRGEDAFEGADLAVSVINRGLDRDAEPFELVALDDRGDPVRAAELVRELAASRRTVGVVYAGPTEGLPPAEDALAAAGIPAVLCAGDLYGARRLTPHVFQASPSLVWESRILARYALDDRRYERVGALVEDSLDGRTALQALRLELERAGGRLAAGLEYQLHGGDLESLLQQLRARHVEALVVQGRPAGLSDIFTGLSSMGARYRGRDAARIASAPRKLRALRMRSGYWHPQVLGFDTLIGDRVGAPPGTVAADTYARGAFYLPVPSFVTFAEAFRRWWDSEPTGWELRAYEAAHMIAWAEGRSRGAGDRAEALEKLDGRRFGGLDVKLGPDDHTAVGVTTVGLWALPRRGSAVPEPAQISAGMVWVPLARGFSVDGERTDIPSRDWRYLFEDPPPPEAQGPRNFKMRFGITTSRRDPLH